MSGLEEYLVKLETLGIILLCIIQTIWTRGPISMTEKGRVQGVSYNVLGKTVDAYLGIPFAKPPLGELRFKHPIPNDPWEGVFDATELPKCCIQGYDDSFGNFSGSQMWNPNTNVSEDCLYLNVWVPRTSERLRDAAVLVWIYGGGFYSGTSTLDVYDAKILAAENEVVVVSMQYRVGMLGFLALGTPEVPGNAGLFDQLLSLEWIQNNIEYFGGDPNNVTLFGESAGSVSVSMHMLSPLSRGKFARAIMQSGTANANWAIYTLEEARNRAKEVAKATSCPQNDWNRMAACFRDKPAEIFPEKEFSAALGIMQFPFIPVIDGSFFIETPTQSLERGNFKKTPILIGSNKDEGVYFLLYYLSELFSIERPHDITYEQFKLSIERLFYYYPQYPQELNSFGISAITFQYTNWLSINDFAANRENLDDAVGDFHLVCGVNKFAELFAKAGQNVYYYYFTHRSSKNPWPVWLGVMHADEINYVFGEPLRPGYGYRHAEKQLSRKMMQYWVNFAKTGNPNKSPGLPSLNEWPEHTYEGREYLELNTKFLNNPDKSKAVGYGPRAQECAFWQEYLPQLVTATGKPVTSKPITCEKSSSKSSTGGQTARPIKILILACLLTIWKWNY